jgi:hypothetical protein
MPVWPHTSPPLRVTAALIGAQKCGTTTLAELLARHPLICLARNKEAHLFDQVDVQRNGPTATQLALYWPEPAPGQLLLDATPSYLYLPGCVEALLRHEPDVRLIVMLRSPGERALSHHGHERRLGAERRNFAMALALEGRRLKRDADPLAANSAHRHFSYRDRGRYAQQLRHLSSLTDQYLVVTLGDLIADPGATLDRIYRFLGLPPHPVGSLPHLNSGDGRNHKVAKFFARWLMRREAAAAERLVGLAPGSLK